MKRLQRLQAIYSIDHSGAARANCCAAAAIGISQMQSAYLVGIERLYSRTLLAQAASRSIASFYDQWLNRPPVQLTLSGCCQLHAAMQFLGA